MIQLYLQTSKTSESLFQTALGYHDAICSPKVQSKRKAAITTSIGGYGLCRAVKGRVTPLVDEGKTVDVVYLNFNKAFDTISHSIFLEKLASVYSSLGQELSRWPDQRMMINICEVEEDNTFLPQTLDAVICLVIIMINTRKIILHQEAGRFSIPVLWRMMSRAEGLQNYDINTLKADEEGGNVNVF
ncbi:hypothetical protein WISP_67696 [Willisornis vidua]|uniref:Reverse transcriptase domain-containing protein n=1 Tax=Willisornis vidua TaxID=1566151 RepID=A0ABQ9DEI4_9PASS|nr:hypothetical protein WISP_67696 [Willisornis vidua]